MHISLKPLFGLALAACAGIACAAGGPQVSQIILLQDDATTRAFVEVSEQSAYKVFLLKGPDRAVLDIEGAEFAPQFKLPGANGVVLAVRQGKTPTGLRVVFDLAQGAKLSDRMDLSGSKPRLVLELMATGPLQAASAPKQAQIEPAPAQPGPPAPDSTVKSAPAQSPKKGRRK